MIAYITPELYHAPEASSTRAVEGPAVDPEHVRTVVLAAGSSARMGWNKLAAPFDGVPLARRVVIALAELRPLVVAGPEVAAVLAGLEGVTLLVTEPTAGPSLSLGLANDALPADRTLAVAACDLPFLTAAAVRAFVRRVPDDADLAFPTVDGTPGHPVVWSPAARTRIAGLGPGQAPVSLRADPGLRVIALAETDDAYVVDVDTPAAWSAAERRALRQSRS
jgi:molybdenum cofactor cytidylyltransferase